MGKGGPQKESTVKLRNRGSNLVKGRDNEPSGGDFTCDCPDWMADDARAKWFNLVPKLKNSGILTELDEDVLARYCVWYSDYVTLKKASPAAYCDLARCEQQLQKLGAKLGLSPSDRVGLSVKAKPEEKDKTYSIKFG